MWHLAWLAAHRQIQKALQILKTPAASKQYAYQASKRGGYLHCRMEENHRIMISVEAALVDISEIEVAL